MRRAMPLGWLALLLVMSIGFVGCSTIEGIGKDIQKGGEAIERAADRNKQAH